jgi:hypothetical protein
VLRGGVLPAVQPARAFASAIPIELLLVPIALEIGWLGVRALPAGAGIHDRSHASLPPSCQSEVMTEVTVGQVGQ